MQWDYVLYGVFAAVILAGVVKLYALLIAWAMYKKKGEDT